MLAVLISQKVLSSLPPFFPKEKTLRLATLIEQNDETMLKNQAENQLTKLSFELWPYKKAFNDFVKLAEEEMADHFLLPLLSEQTGATYLKYREYGMKFSDLYSGGAAHYFSPEERNELLPLLFLVKDKVDEYAHRQVTSLAEKVYHQKVKDYTRILKQVEKELDHLKKMAEKETEFPMLANEIHGRIKGFEEDICGLGSGFNIVELFGLREFFEERKKHLMQMRGLHVSEVFDFYA